MSEDHVNHPAHYGGKDNPYEAIKVIHAWGVGFCLGNALKYICRAGKKGHMINVSTFTEQKFIVGRDSVQDALEDLKKARWYLDEEIRQLEKQR